MQKLINGILGAGFFCLKISLILSQIVFPIPIVLLILSLLSIPITSVLLYSKYNLVTTLLAAPVVAFGLMCFTLIYSIINFITCIIDLISAPVRGFFVGYYNERITINQISTYSLFIVYNEYVFDKLSVFVLNKCIPSDHFYGVSVFFNKIKSFLIDEITCGAKRKQPLNISRKTSSPAHKVELEKSQKAQKKLHKGNKIFEMDHKFFKSKSKFNKANQLEQYTNAAQNKVRFW